MGLGSDLAFPTTSLHFVMILSHWTTLTSVESPLGPHPSSNRPVAIGHLKQSSLSSGKPPNTSAISQNWGDSAGSIRNPYALGP